jgi:hypothetical protein
VILVQFDGIKVFEELDTENINAFEDKSMSEWAITGARRSTRHRE